MSLALIQVKCNGDHYIGLFKTQSAGETQWVGQLSGREWSDNVLGQIPSTD